MKNNENIDIRIKAMEAGIYHADIATLMNITPEHMSRIMKRPLSPKNKKRVSEAIDFLKSQNGNEIQEYRRCIDICKHLNEYDDDTKLHAIQNVAEKGFATLNKATYEKIICFLIRIINKET